MNDPEKIGIIKKESYNTMHILMNEVNISVILEQK